MCIRDRAISPRPLPAREASQPTTSKPTHAAAATQRNSLWRSRSEDRHAYGHSSWEDTSKDDRPASFNPTGRNHQSTPVAPRAHAQEVMGTSTDKLVCRCAASHQVKDTIHTLQQWDRQESVLSQQRAHYKEVIQGLRTRVVQSTAKLEAAQAKLLSVGLRAAEFEHRATSHARNTGEMPLELFEHYFERERAEHVCQEHGRANVLFARLEQHLIQIEQSAGVPLLIAAPVVAPVFPLGRGCEIVEEFIVEEVALVPAAGPFPIAHVWGSGCTDGRSLTELRRAQQSQQRRRSRQSRCLEEFVRVTDCESACRSCYWCTTEISAMQFESERDVRMEELAAMGESLAVVEKDLRSIQRHASECGNQLAHLQGLECSCIAQARHAHGKGAHMSTQTGDLSIPWSFNTKRESAAHYRTQTMSGPKTVSQRVMEHRVAVASMRCLSKCYKTWRSQGSLFVSEKSRVRCAMAHWKRRQVVRACVSWRKVASKTATYHKALQRRVVHSKHKQTVQPSVWRERGLSEAAPEIHEIQQLSASDHWKFKQTLPWCKEASPEVAVAQQAVSIQKEQAPDPVIAPERPSDPVIAPEPPSGLVFTQDGRDVNTIVFQKGVRTACQGVFKGSGEMSCEADLPEGLVLTPTGLVKGIARGSCDTVWVHGIVVTNPSGCCTTTLTIQIVDIGAVVFDDLADLHPDTFNEGDTDHELAVVIISITEGMSFDQLYRKVPQYAGSGLRVSVHHIHSGSVATLTKALESGLELPDEACCQNQYTILRMILDDLKVVEPKAVVFNWECCHGMMRGFPAQHNHIELISAALNRGSMVMCSDYSVNSLISDWQEELLGPNPFVHLGHFSDELQLGFDSDALKRCDSNQLRLVGELCVGNGCHLHAALDSNCFTVDQEVDLKGAYELETLTVVTHMPGWDLSTIQPHLLCTVQPTSHGRLSWHSRGSTRALQGTLCSSILLVGCCWLRVGIGSTCRTWTRPRRCCSRFLKRPTALSICPTYMKNSTTAMARIGAVFALSCREVWQGAVPA
eukprot:TRINITY_DN3311_c0_g1_i12.p1 TRINITY_DN3311_c0_g1~~TRINITY_DN3311_c0_g1_i12.p1  ORF type:complete len:1027 (-),score=104.41 TRINITY_DN3311_c0_g1_i12:713-3793(-)